MNSLTDPICQSANGLVIRDGPHRLLNTCVIATDPFDAGVAKCGDPLSSPDWAAPIGISRPRASQLDQTESPILLPVPLEEVCP